MEKDLPDFLGSEPSSEPEAVAPEAPAREPEAPAAAAPEAPPAEGQPPAGEPTSAGDPAQPPAPPVPLATALEWRDRMTAAEKEARELREWRQQQEEQRRRQPPPSRYDDPEGYERFRDDQIRGALYDQKLDMSRFMAEQRHGAEVVDAAFKWGLERCDADPHFNAKVATSRDPVGLVVAEWRREQIAAKVDPSRYEAFLAWEASQAAGNAGQTPPAGHAPAPQRPAAPRPSIAAAPSAGSTAAPVPRDGAATFDRMFG